LDFTVKLTNYLPCYLLLLFALLFALDFTWIGCLEWSAKLPIEFKNNEYGGTHGGYN